MLQRWNFGRYLAWTLIPAAAMLLVIGCATSSNPGSSSEANVTSGETAVSTQAVESPTGLPQPPASDGTAIQAAATAPSDSQVETKPPAPESLPAAPETNTAPTSPPTVTESTPAEPRLPARGPQAAEVEGIHNWINSEPLTVADLHGKVVLVDFWTYTCVNCIRTFPYLREWHARYADDGLIILGIHTPEFEFEKDYDNVVEATKEHSIVWPVAQDNDFVTWRNYNNRYWPAKYLIDRDGVVRYTHFGEGKYAETEAKILELLFETGADVATQGLEMPKDQAAAPGFNRFIDEVTPELYAGYERNYSAALYGRNPYVVQQEYYRNKDTVIDFMVSDDLLPSKIYFSGPWLIEAERAKHARETTGYEDYIDLKYSAKSVNVVLTSDSGEPYKVRLTINGEYLTEANKGDDVIIGDDGESYILVDEPRLYALVNNPSYVKREVLRMSSNSPDFGIFAFTFGIYEEGI